MSRVTKQPQSGNGASAPRRPLTPAQRNVQPLQPIFAACKSRGLAITPANRDRRAYAVNFYASSLPFEFIESFKDMTPDPAFIAVVADAIEGGWLAW